jgi:hypothetical protein
MTWRAKRRVDEWPPFSCPPLDRYGANQRDTYFRLAAYADRLLRGEKPNELPVQQATVFELVTEDGARHRRRNPSHAPRPSR